MYSFEHLTKNKKIGCYLTKTKTLKLITLSGKKLIRNITHSKIIDIKRAS
jgi:hypothetical protein